MIKQRRNSKSQQKVHFSKSPTKEDELILKPSPYALKQVVGLAALSIKYKNT
jgi:hypothetical protein